MQLKNKLDHFIEILENEQILLEKKKDSSDLHSSFYESNKNLINHIQDLVKLEATDGQGLLFDFKLSTVIKDFIIFRRDVFF